MATTNTSGPGARPPGRTGLQKFLYWGMVSAIWGLIFLVTIVLVFALDLPDTSGLNDVDRQPSVSYLDRSGALLAVRGSRYAPPADIDALPRYVPAAFVAIEDQNFYWHPGFNPWGIARSQVYNLRNRGKGLPLRGGSTITQQLARNLFLSNDQNYRRKIQELILAVWLEVKYSKKEILALYLNRVDFGAGAYGIEAASQRYFNTTADKLSLGQAALLAGLLKGPSRYSPIFNSQRAAARADVVLDVMERTHKITHEQHMAAIAEPVRVSRTLANQNAQYFVDYVDAQVQALVGEATDDLIVETTLDLPIQMAAESAVRQIVGRDKETKGVQQASLVALDGEGRIRAYVGGASYVDSQFDRASNAQRQAGSAFKPFVYLTAMEQGMTPYDQVVDQPIRIGNWEPRNYGGNFLGQITLQTAVAQSVNTIAAKTASDVGTGNVAATARRLGITNRIQLDPSMALGAVEVTPLQMAQAYAPFSNGGFTAHGYGIERIRDTRGQTLYDASLDRPQRAQVITYPALQYMNQMLRQVPISGTGRAARVEGYDIAGKTGTTSDYKDAWFVGYTGGFVAAVWVGKDDNTAMRGVTGGTSPAQIWQAFMAAALPRLAVAEIPGGPAPGPGAAKGPLDAVGDFLSGITGVGRREEIDKPVAAPLTPAPAPTPTAPVAPQAPAALPPRPAPTPAPSQTVIPY